MCVDDVLLYRAAHRSRFWVAHDTQGCLPDYLVEGARAVLRIKVEFDSVDRARFRLERALLRRHRFGGEDASHTLPQPVRRDAFLRRA